MSKNVNKFIEHCIETRTISDLHHAFYMQINGYGKDCREFKIEPQEWFYGIRIAIKKLQNKMNTQGCMYNL